MNILDAIRDRQSIRSFKNKKVSKEIIEDILNISRFAPSGGNTQPWKIYVLSQDLMKDIETSVLLNLDNGVSETPNFNIYTHIFNSLLLKLILAPIPSLNSYGKNQSPDARINFLIFNNY